MATGTSVIALKFSGGVIMAADNLASYGSLARYKNMERIIELSPQCIMSATGDLADFQYIQRLLDSVLIKEEYAQDGSTLSANNLYEYISRVLYARRSKMQPLANQLLVAGITENGESLLGYADLKGTTYTADCLATGYGAALALPLLRKHEHRLNEVSEEEAKELIETCMRVLYYRDARSLNRFTIAIVDKEGVRFEKDRKAKTDWSFAENIRGYGTQTE